MGLSQNNSQIPRGYDDEDYFSDDDDDGDDSFLPSGRAMTEGIFLQVLLPIAAPHAEPSSLRPSKKHPQGGPPNRAAGGGGVGSHRAG